MFLSADARLLFQGAPTPAASAATPAFNSAATPATAPTPGPSGGYNDKTPAGAWSYHANSASSAPTPGGGWGAEPELEEQIRKFCVRFVL